MSRIPKSKLKEQLCAMGIVNNYDLTRKYGEKGRAVWVEYERRAVFQLAGTRVYSHSHRPDPDHHHSRFGAMLFQGKRATSMPMAMAWATAHYRVDDWVPSPFGGRVPRYIRVAAEAAVKENTAL